MIDTVFTAKALTKVYTSGEVRVLALHRNAQVAEVLSGLSPGDRVVLHPSDRVTDGAAVSQRQSQ
jgi:hypothetical protein